MPRKYLTPEEIKNLSLNDLIQQNRKAKVPIYTRENTKCVHSLYYDWTGWGSEKAPIPRKISEAIEICIPLWDNDGFILEKWKTEADMLQTLFKVKPEIPPILLTQKVKGRLDNALRKLETPLKFSRKVGFRCLGENTREVVNLYVQKQVGKSDYADDRFKNFLREYSVSNESADLAEPFVVAHGRYWFNIHLVIVADDRRNPVTKKENFERIKIGCFKIAAKKCFVIARLAVMPDHIHISLRGNPNMSPVDIGLSFLNNLSYLLGYNHCWNDEFYVGTFSEYSLKKLFN